MHGEGRERRIRGGLLCYGYGGSGGQWSSVVVNWSGLTGAAVSHAATS